MQVKKKRRKYYFLIILVLIVIAIGIIAATRNVPQTGDLMVHVVDAKGNLISGANITISGPYTANVVAESGYHLFQPIPVGTYTVTAQTAGYNQGSETANVTVGETSHVTIKLSPS